MNTITGSITLTYDAAVVDGEALKARLHAHGHIHQPMAAQGDATTETTGRGSAEWITRVLATMLIEKVVEHSALALVAAII